nr:hypothetical protein [Tanacetum cinerariifolium]
MFLELADRTISKPTGVAENVYVKTDQQSLTIQCSDIPSVKKIEQINKIEFINAGGIDSESEEIEDFLNDESIPFGIEDSPFNMDKEILFLEKSSTKNLIPIPNECIVVSENGSRSTEPINDDSSNLLSDESTMKKSEDSDLDNPLLPLPPPEPPDKEFDFEIDFSVERNLIVKFECIDARIKFDVENDVFKFIMFSLLSAESEDTIFDPGISD